MRRTILAFFFALFAAAVAQAQSTTVTSTVTDTGGVVWVGGNYKFTFVGAQTVNWPGGAFNRVVSGTLDNTGSFSVSLPSTSTMTGGAGASWTLQVTPITGISQGSITITGIATNGGTQPLTVTPNAIQIVGASPLPVAAYADAEIVAPVQRGMIYYQVTSATAGTYRQCQGLTGNACTTWGNVGSGGGGGGITSITTTSPITGGPITTVGVIGCPTCLTTSSGIVFPVTLSGAVTSGGIPYFNSTTQASSSALLTLNSPILGGGAGGSPFTATFLTTDAISQLNVGVAGAAASGAVNYVGSTSGSRAITVPAVAGSATPIALPSTNGVSGQAVTVTSGANEQWGYTTLAVAPNNTPAIGGEALTAYNSATGAFTQAAFGGGGSAFPVTVSGTVTSGGIPCFTSTTTEETSTLLAATNIVVGGGAGVCPSTSVLQIVNSGTIWNAVSTTQTILVGGQDASSASILGGALVRGGNQTGAGGAGSAGGNAIVEGGNNNGTNAASQAGSVELIPGSSVGATQGLQGLLAISESYVKGGGTSTLWNLQCIVTTTAMTVNDCGASPSGIIGVALSVNTNTVQVHVVGSQTPVNASAAVTVGDTVCAGTTAGVVTDSGGTAPCTTGFTVGQVIAVAGTWNLPISGNVTLSTTLPLIAFNRASGVGNAANVGFSGIGSGTNTTAAMVVGTGASFAISTPGAASFSPLSMTGACFVGTGTNSVPCFYINQGTAPTTWSTGAGGTLMGGNGPSGFAGNYIDFHTNGGGSVFNVNSTGQVTSAGGVFSAASSGVGPVGRSLFSSAANGRATININANTANGLTRLTFGTEAAAQPAFCFNGTTALIQTCDGAGTISGGLFQSAALTVGLAGTTSGVLTLAGSTSGGATFTAPAVAGTSTNGVTSSNVLLAPTGAQATTSYGFIGHANYGIYFNSNAGIVVEANGSDSYSAATSGVVMPGGDCVGWLASAAQPMASNSFDTAVSRSGIGVLSADTTACANGLGTIRATNYDSVATHLIISSTAPTIASGFGTTPTIPNNNGTAAFTVNVGTGGVATSGVITMPAATAGWSCHVDPNGAPQAAAVTYSAPTSTTSITLTNYTQSTGVALAWTASTVLQLSCFAY
jgi:hypothetical protein